MTQHKACTYNITIMAAQTSPISIHTVQRPCFWLFLVGQRISALEQTQLPVQSKSHTKSPHFTFLVFRPLHIKPFTKPTGKWLVNVWIWKTNLFFKPPHSIFSGRPIEMISDITPQRGSAILVLRDKDFIILTHKKILICFSKDLICLNSPSS